MTNIMRGLLRPGFHRNAASLMIAAVGSQLLWLLGSPVLTRLYSPSEFGVTAIYVAILGTLSVVSALRYDLAIIVPKRDEHAIALAQLAAMITALFAVATLVVVLLMGERLDRIFNTTGVWKYLLLIPVGIVCIGLYQIALQLATRAADFRSIATTKIQQAAAGVVSQILLGVVGFGAIGLIVGQVVGQALGVRRLSKEHSASKIFKVNLVRLRAVARRHRKFPIFTSSGALVNAAGNHLPAILFAALFSPAYAGYYLLAQKVGAGPLTLIGRNLSQALLAEGVGGNPRIGRKAVAAMEQLLRLGTVPILVVGISSPFLFPSIFGREWTTAGVFLALLCPWLAAQFFVNPVAITITIMGRQQAQFYLHLLLFVVRAAGILYGAANNDPLLSAAMYGAGSAIVYLLFGWFIFRMVGVAFTRTVVRILVELAVLSLIWIISVAVSGPLNVPVEVTLLTLGGSYGIARLTQAVREIRNSEIRI